MYNYGLVKFLQVKKLKSNEAINAYLSYKNITEFNAKNHNRVNYFLVRLNYHFEEQKNRHLEVRKECEKENLSKDEEYLINLETYFSKVHSFICKQGLKVPPKDYNYTSKKLGNMSLIRLLREHNLVNDCVLYVKECLSVK